MRVRQVTYVESPGQTLDPYEDGVLVHQTSYSAPPPYQDGQAVRQTSYWAPESMADRAVSNAVVEDSLVAPMTSLVNGALEEADSRSTWLKNQVAGSIGAAIVQQLRDRIDDAVRPDAVDPIVDSYGDLVRASNPQNLSQGVRTYMTNLVDRFETYFTAATDPFIAD